MDLLSYKSLFTMGTKLLAEPDLNQLLILAMDSIISLSQAERGLIILFDQSGNSIFEVARSLNQENIKNPEFEISHTIMNQVRERGEFIYIKNAYENGTSQQSKSVLRLKILSIICLPLIQKEKIFGVVYLDNRTIRGVFQEGTCQLIKEFGLFISMAAYRALERKQLQNHVTQLEKEIRDKFHFDSIIGCHPKMVEVLKTITQVADTDATVLIQSESGTGKELIAHAIHANSRRMEKPFIPVNCAALPESLLESELFGHVRGAFTGAVKDKPGLFERADGGTIFLDEVGDMPLPLQVKLLRILQTGEYSLLGSPEIRFCDVRVIAATSQDLALLVQSGRFREELYYRLNVIDIIIPPLRERKSDLPLLIANFLKIYGDKYQKEHLKLSSEAENLIQQYDYPGNVRELENIIQRAIILGKGDTIHAVDLPVALQTRKAGNAQPSPHLGFKEAKEHAVQNFERQYLSSCLESTKGNITKAARLAGMNIKNFHTKMKRYQIDPHYYKK